MSSMAKHPCLIGLMSDLLLWTGLTVVLVLLFPGMWNFFIPHFKLPGYQTIALRFKDASQLTAGSPVAWLGVDVGTVARVVPKSDHVEVDIRLFEKNVSIPPGAEFTIEFNGLVGAKSLEVLPASSVKTPYRKGKQPFVVHEPIRIKDVFDLQNEMGQAIEMTYDSVYNALGNIESEPSLRHRLNRINQKFSDARLQVASIGRDVNNYQSRIDQSLINGLDVVTNIRRRTDVLVSITQPYKLQQARSNFSQLGQDLQRSEDVIRKIMSPSTWDVVQHDFDRVRTTIQKNHRQFNTTSTWLGRSRGQLTRFQSRLQSDGQAFDLQQSRESIQRFGQCIKRFDYSIQGLNDKL